MNPSSPRIHTPELTEPEPGVGLSPVMRTCASEPSIDRLWLVWNQRRFLVRATLVGLLVGAVVAFLVPKQFQSTTQLMPPDDQSSSAVAIMAGLSARTGD